MPAVERSLVTLAAWAGALLPAYAQDGVLDRTPVECISVSRIDQTEILDDNTILFYMRGDEIYRNHLPRRCPGLERNERFSYRTSTSRLCDIDTVTVLEQWGARLQSGFTCALGMFHPITAEEAEELELIKKEGGRARDAIEAEPVELPPAQDAGAAEPEAETN